VSSPATGESGHRIAKPPGLSAWTPRRWAVLAGLSWLASGALYLTLPPSSDQFNHAYLGWRLIEGDIPYRDFIDANWPGVSALHALACWIFGINLWSWRAFDFLLFTLSALFLSDLARLAAGRVAGRLGLVLLPLIYAGATYGMAGEHDMSAAQLLVPALWFHVRGYERKAWWYQLGAGILLGAAMLNKPTVGVIGLLFPLQALWHRYPLRGVIGQTTAAGAAAVATLLAALAALLARGASLHEIIDTVYTYNATTQFTHDVSLARVLDELMLVHLLWYPVLALGGIFAFTWLCRSVDRSIAMTALPVLWITGVLSEFIQWRGYAYHLAPSLLALAGGLVISVALIATGRAGFGNAAWKRRIGAGLIGLALAGIGQKLVSSYYSLPLALLDGNYARHLSRFNVGDDLSGAETMAFVRRLDAASAGNCVLVVGWGSAIPYLSRHRVPSRFYYFDILLYARPPLPMAERWVDLWEQDLKAADCRFALVRQWIQRDWLPGPTRAASALRGFLEGYRESGVLGADAGTAVFGGTVVYERK
jgi:hypothetical protein